MVSRWLVVLASVEFSVAALAGVAGLAASFLGWGGVTSLGLAGTTAGAAGLVGTGVGVGVGVGVEAVAGAGVGAGAAAGLASVAGAGARAGAVAGLASVAGGVSAGLAGGGAAVTGLMGLLAAGTPFTLGTVWFLAGASVTLLTSTGFWEDGASLTAGFCGAGASVGGCLGWGAAGVMVAGVVAGLVGEAAEDVGAVVTGGVAGLGAGCAGLAVTVTGGGLVGLGACAWVCGAAWASVVAGLGVEADAAAGVAAGWLAGLAGTGVTVAGMGTTLAGAVTACACTGLTWVPRGRELRADLATLGVMDTEGVGGFGRVEAFWETGGLAGWDCCCGCEDTRDLRGCWF